MIFLVFAVNLFAQEFKGIRTGDQIEFYVKFKDGYEARCNIKDVIIGRKSNDDMTFNEECIRDDFLDPNEGGYIPDNELEHPLYWNNEKRILVFGIDKSILTDGIDWTIFVWNVGKNEKPRFATIMYAGKASYIRSYLASTDGRYLACLFHTREDYFDGYINLIDIENVNKIPINLRNLINFDPNYYPVVSQIIWSNATKLNVCLDIYPDVDTWGGQDDKQNCVAVTWMTIDLNNGSVVLPKKKLDISDIVKKEKNKVKKNVKDKK